MTQHPVYVFLSIKESVKAETLGGVFTSGTNEGVCRKCYVTTFTVLPASFSNPPHHVTTSGEPVKTAATENIKTNYLLVCLRIVNNKIDLHVRHLYVQYIPAQLLTRKVES